jgi:transposase-like protein
LIVLIELNDQSFLRLDPRLAALAAEHGADGYRLYLEELRWPLGVACPRCESGDVLWLERRRRHHCRRCRYQFRVTARTVFHDSHLSLRKWFLAVALMLSHEGISAVRLHRIFGGSYKSAWFLEHRIRSAMATPSSFGGPIGYAAVRLTAEAVRPLLPEEGVSAPPNWPLLRSLIAGGHRHVGLKYFGAYWDEARWRDANRANPNAFRDTVLALLAHPWLPFDSLVHGAETAP